MPELVRWHDRGFLNCQATICRHSSRSLAPRHQAAKPLHLPIKGSWHSTVFASSSPGVGCLSIAMSSVVRRPSWLRKERGAVDRPVPGRRLGRATWQAAAVWHRQEEHPPNLLRHVTHGPRGTGVLLRSDSTGAVHGYAVPVAAHVFTQKIRRLLAVLAFAIGPAALQIPGTGWTTKKVLVEPWLGTLCHLGDDAG